MMTWSSSSAKSLTFTTSLAIFVKSSCSVRKRWQSITRKLLSELGARPPPSRRMCRKRRSALAISGRLLRGLLRILKKSLALSSWIQRWMRAMISSSVRCLAARTKGWSENSTDSSRSRRRNGVLPSRDSVAPPSAPCMSCCASTMPAEQRWLTILRETRMARALSVSRMSWEATFQPGVVAPPSAGAASHCRRISRTRWNMR